MEHDRTPTRRRARAGRHARAALATVVLALFPLASARAGDPDVLQRIKTRGELRWGADALGGAPYVFHDPTNTNKLIGFEVDLADALAAKLGAKATFVQSDYKTLLDLLGRGDDIDVAINGIEANEEKKRICELSHSYYIASERMCVRAKDAWKPASLAETKGRPIGTLPTTLAEKLLREAGANVKTYDVALNEVFAELTNDRIDGVLIDEPTVLYYAPGEEGIAVLDRSFGEIEYAVAAPKGQIALKGAIDKALEELRAEGKLREIYERWGLWNLETAQLLGDRTVHVGARSPAYEEFLRNTAKRPFLERVKDYPRYLPRIGLGVLMTLEVSLLSFALAVSVGCVLALSRRYGPWPIKAFAATYIEVFRGTPLLVQLFFIYFALPDFGISLQPLAAGVIGLGLNYAAAEAENYRAGLESVPGGQLEACWSLGLSTWQAVRYVVVPQAVRVAIPPATNDFIALLKDSSLVSAIGLADLLATTHDLASSTRDNRGMFLLCALIYLLIGLPFALFARWVERRMGQHLRRVES